MEHNIKDIIIDSPEVYLFKNITRDINNSFCLESIWIFVFLSKKKSSGYPFVSIMTLLCLMGMPVLFDVSLNVI